MNTRNLLILGVCALAAFGLLGLLTRSPGKSTAEAVLSSQVSTNASQIQQEPYVVIGDSQNEIPEHMQNSASGQPQMGSLTLPLASRKSPSELTLSDLDYTTKRNAQNVLVLVDGSEVVVTPNVYDQLTGNIKVRLEVSYEY